MAPALWPQLQSNNKGGIAPSLSLSLEQAKAAVILAVKSQGIAAHFLFLWIDFLCNRNHLPSPSSSASLQSNRYLYPIITERTKHIASKNIHMPAVQSKMGLFKSLSYRSYDLGVLSFYDVWVLWISCTYAWKAPVKTTLLPFFQAHFSKNHLDIGVGTGYFPATILREAQLDDHQLALLDLSITALRKTKARVEAVAPHVRIQAIQADATVLPDRFDTTQKYDSISASLLLHCIPMSASHKIRGLVSTAQQLLSPTGVFFGATVLGTTERAFTAPSADIDWMGNHDVQFGFWGEAESATPLNFFGKALMWAYNHTRIFSNWEDEPDVFVEALEAGFQEVDSWIIGRVLFFRAQGPHHLGEDSSR